MHQIHLSDQAYEEATRRAQSAGFETVDEYIVDLLVSPVGPQEEDLGHLFTPERLAKIDKAAEEIAKGQFNTEDEVRERLKKRLG